MVGTGVFIGRPAAAAASVASALAPADVSGIFGMPVQMGEGVLIDRIVYIAVFSRDVVCAADKAGVAFGIEVALVSFVEVINAAATAALTRSAVRSCSGSISPCTAASACAAAGRD